MDDLCVLVPVYAGTQAGHLRAALASLAAQTRLAPVVLVEDGPLSRDQMHVLDEAAEMLQIRRTAQPHRGIAAALNRGLTETDARWVARMDADDVAEPDRLAVQSRVLREGRTDVLGSAMLEFETTPDLVTGLRRMPLAHDEILARMRVRNPVNHPTVVIDRERVLALGGYRHLPGLEDYDLWARLASDGARFENLRSPLVRYRVDADLFRRRGARHQLSAELTLQRNLIALGLVSRPRAAVNLTLRAGYRMLPPGVMRQAYRVVRS